MQCRCMLSAQQQRGECSVSDALKRESHGPFPESWWSEDDGDVLWWAWDGTGWLGEPPYVGSPLDCGITVEMRSADQPDKVIRHSVGGWPGYHTHWTRLPAMPPAPEWN